MPFPGEGFGEVLVAHLTKPPTKPSTVNPNLPPPLESIVLHAIEKDRNRRFQNMDEFVAALENPEAHAAQWHGLPAYASAGAATLQTMPAVKQPPKQGARWRSTRRAAGRCRGGPPRPTTLEGAAAEVTSPPTRAPRNRAPLIAGGRGAVGAGGRRWMARAVEEVVDGERAGDERAGARGRSAEDGRRRRMTRGDASSVTSDPPGAKVYRADKSEAETEKTPLTFRMKRGDPPFDIQLRRGRVCAADAYDLERAVGEDGGGVGEVADGAAADADVHASADADADAGRVAKPGGAEAVHAACKKPGKMHRRLRRAGSRRHHSAIDWQLSALTDPRREALH